MSTHMLPFFQAPNLKVQTLAQGEPWDFAPTADALRHWRSLPKQKRRDDMVLGTTEWNAYSSVGGLAPNLRVSNENPPTVLRGLVCDYDLCISVETAVGLLNQLKPAYLPNFIEVSLGKKARLVWVFEREVLIPDSKFCGDLLQAFVDQFGAETLLPGYDKGSTKPAAIWTNGGEWHNVAEKPIAWETVFGVLCLVSKKTSFGDAADIPLPRIAEEIEKRFPKRWQGDFNLELMGVRFWDAQADNPKGCQIKPDGMLCFTGRTPFMPWDRIFGASWCNEQRALNLGKAAGERYFDGHHYWQQNAGMWVQVSREDSILQFKTSGVNPKPARGQTASDVDRVLNHIQTVNRVIGAAPLINYRPGILKLNGDRVLNISTLRPLAPSEKTNVVPEVDFPWTWRFFSGLFDHPELFPKEYFMAWLKRCYMAQSGYHKAMGQAVFLCGPKDNGKSLVCFRYLKPLLGDKIANPYDYFTGITTFNDELFESPLLAINDEEAPARDEARQKFIARLKSFVVNPSHTYHPKFCKRLSVEWTGRVFSTLNDDPASVGLLPEVNENTKDKLMYFASRAYEGVWDDQHVIEARIDAELPFFARWLIEWQPPEFVRAPGRMGVKSFFDPRVLGFSQQQGPAYILLELIKIWVRDGSHWTQGVTEWVGTGSELLNQFACVDHLHPLVKEWTSRRIAGALTTLARLEGVGVTLVETPNSRTYRLTKKEITPE